jgi:hypothetical protein
MSIRTHLTLQRAGKPQDIGPFKNLPSMILILDEYCIGKLFFDEIPQIIENIQVSEKISFDEDETSIFIDGSYGRGEIRVDTLMSIIETIREKPTHTAWDEFDFTWLYTRLKTALETNVITKNHYIEISCY